MRTDPRIEAHGFTQSPLGAAASEVDRLRGQIAHLQDALETIERTVGFVPKDEPLSAWVERAVKERDEAQAACAEMTAKIAEHDDACELVQEYVDATAAAMDETCGKDEKHCTCVPLLRFEANRIRAEAATYAKAVHRLQKAFDDQCKAARQDAAEIERLKAACAEMREILERVKHADTAYGVIPNTIMQSVYHALSADCGKGWLSPEVGKSLVEALAHLAAYAGTVRTDRTRRMDEMNIMAEQTLDWCHGLLEKCELANKALSRANEAAR